MAIACAYCGGEHDAPAQVRQCWHDGGRPDVADAPPEPDEGAEGATFAFDSQIRSGSSIQARPTRPGTTGGATPRRARPTVTRGVGEARSGPSELGRGVLVVPGQAVPEPWTGASVFLVDDDALRSPSEAIAQLREARRTGARFVVELAAEFDDDPLSMVTEAPFTLGARFSFDLDELHHLVWSNTIDARQPDRWTWHALDVAIASGATEMAQPAERSVNRSSGAGGDVILADGTAVWIDGGPVRFLDPIDGVPVIHVVALEHAARKVADANTSAADLAPDQLAAVTHPGGAARIIAPAGSGKTRVLTERARHLLTRWNLPASSVSLVAFNKRAQEEMRERTSDLPGLQVRTLNAIALAIVNGSAPFAPQARSWRTIDEPEVRRIIGDLVSFPRQRNSDPVAPWIEALSLVRLGLVSPERAELQYDGDVDGLPGVWQQFRQRLERQGAVDFDDQIYRALLVLLTQPEARRAAQRACRLMLVDEFQDLTPAHLLLIRLLAAPGGDVFGVGDDDQTIYGYNGADPAWLIDFSELFPGAGDHPLEVNYRCPAGTVEVVDRLLRHNTRRVAKTIRAASTDRGGWSVDRAVDPIAASRAAVERAIGDGAQPTEVAVLTRVNAILAPIQVALASAGVPVAGGVGLEFADRTAVRSVLAWLRLAAADRGGSGFAPDDLREALRRPSRSFHPRINDWVTEQRSVVELHKLAARLNKERDTDRVTEFAADIHSLQKLVASGASTSDVVFELIDVIGLAGSVATLDAHRRGMNRAAQGDDLTAVRQLAALHDDVATFESWLRSHLAVKRSSEGVLLATVHRVKGQEWPHVVVHLADAEQYPHRLADDVEEERRLFHVAITRASQHATIVTGPRPSPFVDELTNEPSERRVVSSHRPEPVATAKRTGGPTSDDLVASLDDDGRRRFEALKGLRNELRDGKPAYVVFDNKTLVAIARTLPTSRSELSRIPGIGPAKLDQYGEAVLALLTTL
jgi:DNA helicase II / ATP-dependent DNA helicase PcrA